MLQCAIVYRPTFKSYPVTTNLYRTQPLHHPQLKSESYLVKAVSMVSGAQTARYSVRKRSPLKSLYFALIIHRSIRIYSTKCAFITLRTLPEGVKVIQHTVAYNYYVVTQRTFYNYVTRERNNSNDTTQVFVSRLVYRPHTSNQLLM